MTTAALLDTVTVADAVSLLQMCDDNSVNCIVTSPPYFGLRDYGVDGQIGLERSPSEYVATLATVFEEVFRVLRDDGVLWLNLGDSYASGKGQSGSQGAEHQETRNKNQRSLNKGYQTLGGKKQTKPTDDRAMMRDEGLRSKSLIGIPWRVAFALMDIDWILRMDVIWSKPNPMPESVKDRPTKSHEYLFMFTKSSDYAYDADAIAEKSLGLPAPTWEQRKAAGEGMRRGYSQNAPTGAKRVGGGETRNARSVWTIPTEPNNVAHFATMPTKLVRRCIMAGCPPRGIVLDMFSGSGTTALVARDLNCHYIAGDLNPEYVALAQQRLDAPYTLPMFD